MGRIREMRKIGVGLTVTSLLLLFIGATWMMSGCSTSREEKTSSQSSVTAETPEAKASGKEARPIPSKPRRTVGTGPFNNQTDCEKWGDETYFFRGLELEDEIMLNDYTPGSLSLGQDRKYVLAVHCHNSSYKDFENVKVEVDYPMIVKGENEAYLSMTYDKGIPSLKDTLILKSEKALRLQPLAGSEVIVTDSEGGKVRFTADGSAGLKTAASVVILEKVPKGADYTIFVMLETSEK